MKRLRIAQCLKVIGTALAVSLYCINTESCANTSGGPTGGPKDSIPPVVVSRIPDTAVTGFPVVKGKIVITFNEYVQLKNANTAVVFSPPLKKRPTVRIKKKSILVEFPDSLRANQSYSINFGNAISDVNEGNPFNNYVYEFSTGKSLDSMIISGTVMDYKTLLPLKDVTVALYETPRDSSVFKDVPTAVAKSDDWGYFCVRALKGVPYRIYAYGDINNDYLYSPGVEQAGFCDSLITPSLAAKEGMPQIARMNMKDTLKCLSRPSQTDIYLFKEKSKSQFIKNYGRTAMRAAFVSFNAEDVQIDTFMIKGIYNDKIIKQFNEEKDSLCFWINERRKLSDTLSLRINYRKTDSLGKLVPYGETLKFAMPIEKQEKNKNNSSSSSGNNLNRGNRNNRNGQTNTSGLDKEKRDKEKRKDLLEMKMSVKSETMENDGFKFEFPAPLVKCKFDSIRFSCTTPRRITTNVEYTFIQDSTDILRYTLQSKEPYKNGNDYEVIVPKGIFMDINGFTNDSIAKKISLPIDDKLSSITLEIKNTEGGRYLVELVNEKRDNVYLKYVIFEEKNLLFPYLQPGNYSVRITEDKNGNGKLDIGSIFEMIEPEKARLLKLTGGSSVIKLKERTDITQTIDVKSLFAK